MINEVINIQGVDYIIVSSVKNKDGSYVLQINPHLVVSNNMLYSEIESLCSRINSEKITVRFQSELVLGWMKKCALSYHLPASQLIEMNTNVVHTHFRTLINSLGVGWHEIMHVIWWMLNDSFWIKKLIPYLQTWGNDGCAKFKRIQSEMANTVHEIEFKPMLDADSDNRVEIT